MLDDYRGKHGEPEPRAITEEEDPDGQMVRGVIRARNLDGPEASLPPSVFQIWKKRVRGVQPRRRQQLAVNLRVDQVRPWEGTVS